MKTSHRPALQPPAAAPPDLLTAGSDARTGAVSIEQRHALIERVAYLLAESRGFSPGEELNDWLAAEAEVDRKLSGTEVDAK
jgi:hypothetical protein